MAIRKRKKRKFKVDYDYENILPDFLPISNKIPFYVAMLSEYSDILRRYEKTRKWSKSISNSPRAYTDLYEMFTLICWLNKNRDIKISISKALISKFLYRHKDSINGYITKDFEKRMNVLRTGKYMSVKRTATIVGLTRRCYDAKN